jgi:hypothetical protein
MGLVGAVRAVALILWAAASGSLGAASATIIEEQFKSDASSKDTERPTYAQLAWHVQSVAIIEEQ